MHVHACLYLHTCAHSSRGAAAEADEKQRTEAEGRPATRETREGLAQKERELAEGWPGAGLFPPPPPLSCPKAL